MGTSVGGAHLIGDVVHRCREQVVVVDEHRCCEDEVEFHGSAHESIIGVRGEHVDALLRCELDTAVVGLHLAIEAEVGIGTTGGVMAV